MEGDGIRMKKCRVAVKYPHIRIEIGDEVYELEGWEAEVQNLDDLRHSFAESPNVLFQALLYTLSSGNLKAEITFEGKEGVQAQVPFQMAGYDWWTFPTISEQSIRAKMGEEIAVRYMGRLHKTLYLTSILSRDRMNQPRTLATLETLGLIENLRVTDKGAQVLEQLQELGPPQNSAGLVMQANELLDIYSFHDSHNPLRVWLQQRLLITPRLTGSGRDQLTNGGYKWLTVHGRQLLSLTSFIHRTALIPFLPAEALNEFLTSDDGNTRDLAKMRMRELREHMKSARGELK